MRVFSRLGEKTMVRSCTVALVACWLLPGLCAADTITTPFEGGYLGVGEMDALSTSVPNGSGQGGGEQAYMDNPPGRVSISTGPLLSGSLSSGTATFDGGTYAVYVGENNTLAISGTFVGDPTFTSFVLQGEVTGVSTGVAPWANYGSTFDGELTVLSSSETDLGAYAIAVGSSLVLNPVVPLPASAWLMLSGVVGLGAMVRKRRAD
jgi:hypothetical protein